MLKSLLIQLILLVQNNQQVLLKLEFMILLCIDFYNFTNTSETTNGVTFSSYIIIKQCFSTSSVSIQNIIKNGDIAYKNDMLKDPSFISWFIGFSEGDGSWNIDSNSKRVYFKIRQKEYEVLKKIHDFFGFGSLYLSADGYYTWSVQNKFHTYILISIFNGHLHLNKTNQRFLCY
jgi:hypothetical protein